MYICMYVLTLDIKQYSMKLEWNGLGSWRGGAKEIAEALVTNTVIKSLDLRNNQISHEVCTINRCIHTYICTYMLCYKCLYMYWCDVAVVFIVNLKRLIANASSRGHVVGKKITCGFSSISTAKNSRFCIRRKQSD